MGALATTLWSCGGAPQEARGDTVALGRYLQKLNGSPVVIFVWAPWSRQAVELEPTMAELAAEFQPFGVEFVTVALDADEGPADSPLRLFYLEGSLPETMARFGVNEVPAILTLSPEGRLVHRLGSADGRLDPGDIADAIEAATVAHDKRRSP